MYQIFQRMFDYYEHCKKYRNCSHCVNWCKCKEYKIEKKHILESENYFIFVSYEMPSITFKIARVHGQSTRVLKLKKN